MIPEKVINVLRNGFGHLGSVSEQKKPRHTDTLGVMSDSNLELLTCFVRSDITIPLRENLRSTNRVCLFTGAKTHEAYQLKGRLIDIRTMTSSELDFSSEYRQTMIAVLASVGISGESADKMFGKSPDLSIIFKIENIFIQTPGPQAGKKMNFERVIYD